MKFHWSDIQNIAKAHHCEDPVENVEAFKRFLRFWWCRHFNRPMNDPLLREYTLDELCYEFLRYYYMNPDHDPKKELEAKRVKEEEDLWIRAQMAKIAAGAGASSTDPQAVEPNQEISTNFEE
jgi:hypothetical protein